MAMNGASYNPDMVSALMQHLMNGGMRRGGPGGFVKPGQRGPSIGDGDAGGPITTLPDGPMFGGGKPDMPRPMPMPLPMPGGGDDTAVIQGGPAPAAPPGGIPPGLLAAISQLHGGPPVAGPTPGALGGMAMPPAGGMAMPPAGGDAPPPPGGAPGGMNPAILQALMRMLGGGGGAPAGGMPPAQGQTLQQIMQQGGGGIPR